MTKTDAILDAVIALWKSADSDREDAAIYEAAMKNSTKIAEDKEDEAERLWRPLAEKHPEWFDALKDGEDPRT